MKKTAAGTVAVAGVRITHADRVVYPDVGLTKQDVAEYYAAVADWMLPYVVDRPLSLVRCPVGLPGQCFYQKHLTGRLPKSVQGVMIKEKDARAEYVVIRDLEGLLALVQFGVLEFHPWPARSDKLENPDRLVFDLDPGNDVPWANVAQAAREVRKRLADLGLESFVRTTGGKGLHVVVPLSRRTTWEDLKRFAQAFAVRMSRDAPETYLSKMNKASRRGKTFVDYLRNQRGATAIASYSTRARPGAPVSAPLAWNELSNRTRPDGFNVVSMPKRLVKLAADPWKGFFEVRQSLSRAMHAALA